MRAAGIDKRAWTMAKTGTTQHQEKFGQITGAIAAGILAFIAQENAAAEPANESNRRPVSKIYPNDPIAWKGLNPEQVTQLISKAASVNDRMAVVVFNANGDNPQVIEALEIAAQRYAVGQQNAWTAASVLLMDPKPNASGAMKIEFWRDGKVVPATGFITEEPSGPSGTFTQRQLNIIENKITETMNGIRRAVTATPTAEAPVSGRQ